MPRSDDADFLKLLFSPATAAGLHRRLVGHLETRKEEDGSITVPQEHQGKLINYAQQHSELFKLLVEDKSGLFVLADGTTISALIKERMAQDVYYLIEVSKLFKDRSWNITALKEDLLNKMLTDEILRDYVLQNASKFEIVVNADEPSVSFLSYVEVEAIKNVDRFIQISELFKGKVWELPKSLVKALRIKASENAELYAELVSDETRENYITRDRVGTRQVADIIIEHAKSNADYFFKIIEFDGETIFDLTKVQKDVLKKAYADEAFLAMIMSEERSKQFVVKQNGSQKTLSEILISKADKDLNLKEKLLRISNDPRLIKDCLEALKVGDASLLLDLSGTIPEFVTRFDNSLFEAANSFYVFTGNIQLFRLIVQLYPKNIVDNGENKEIAQNIERKYRVKLPVDCNGSPVVTPILSLLAALPCKETFNYNFDYYTNKGLYRHSATLKGSDKPGVFVISDIFDFIAMAPVSTEEKQRRIQMVLNVYPDETKRLLIVRHNDGFVETKSLFNIRRELGIPEERAGQSGHYIHPALKIALAYTDKPETLRRQNSLLSRLSPARSEDLQSQGTGLRGKVLAQLVAGNYSPEDLDTFQNYFTNRCYLAALQTVLDIRNEDRSTAKVLIRSSLEANLPDCEDANERITTSAAELLDFVRIVSDAKPLFSESIPDGLYARLAKALQDKSNDMPRYYYYNAMLALSHMVGEVFLTQEELLAMKAFRECFVGKEWELCCNKMSVTVYEDEEEDLGDGIAQKPRPIVSIIVLVLLGLALAVASIYFAISPKYLEMVVKPLLSDVTIPQVALALTSAGCFVGAWRLSVKPRPSEDIYVKDNDDIKMNPLGNVDGAAPAQTAQSAC